MRNERGSKLPLTLIKIPFTEANSCKLELQFPFGIVHHPVFSVIGSVIEINPSI